MWATCSEAESCPRDCGKVDKSTGVFHLTDRVYIEEFEVFYGSDFSKRLGQTCGQQPRGLRKCLTRSSVLSIRFSPWAAIPAFPHAPLPKYPAVVFFFPIDFLCLFFWTNLLCFFSPFFFALFLLFEFSCPVFLLIRSLASRGGKRSMRRFRKRKRKCKNCHDYFLPDYRNRRRQKFCSQPSCRKASKACNHRQASATIGGRYS